MTVPVKRYPVFALCTLLFCVAPNSQAAQEKQLAADCYLKIGPSLHKSGGRLTPELRKVYLDWARSTVLKALIQKNRTVSQDCMAEVDQDPALADAMFGAVYPPDPSVLQNYAQLRAQMGLSFTKNYRSLAMGIAVARRIRGVELDQSIGRENQVPIWADITL
jgi:hypothetical protein